MSARWRYRGTSGIDLSRNVYEEINRCTDNDWLLLLLSEYFPRKDTLFPSLGPLYVETLVTPNFGTYSISSYGSGDMPYGV